MWFITLLWLNNCIDIRKDVKTVFLADTYNCIPRNPTDSSKKCSRLTKEFCKTVVHKINTKRRQLLSSNMSLNENGGNSIYNSDKMYINNGTTYEKFIGSMRKL